MGSSDTKPRVEGELLVRTATSDDCVRIVPELTISDYDEIEATMGLSPQDGLLAAYARSTEAFVIERNGQVVAIGGLVEDEDPDVPFANVWMLATPKVRKVPISFTKVIRAWLSEYATKYGALYGYADARNKDHIKWIARNGFTIIRIVEEMGPQKRPFYEFVYMEGVTN